MREFIQEKYKNIKDSIYSTDYSSIYPDFINFALGDPDLRTHEMVIKEAYNSQMKGFTHYEDPQGYLGLRKEIAKAYKEDFGVKCQPEEILITMSGQKPYI